MKVLLAASVFFLLSSCTNLKNGENGKLSSETRDAKIIYVKQGGDDQVLPGDNSLEHPYATLKHAASLVQPGDTVYVLNGIYEPVSLTKPGSEGKPITWMAYPGHRPEIVSSGWYGIDVKASYQTIDGFTLTGNNDNVTLEEAEKDYYKSIPTFFVKNPKTGVNDVNPFVRNPKTQAIEYNPAAGKAVTADTPNPTYIANYVPSGAFNGNGINLNNSPRVLGDKDPAHNLTVKNCIVRKFGGGGIAVLFADYIVLENNKIYENSWYSRFGTSGGTLFTINKDPDDANTGYRNKITGNMFWNNRGLVKWITLGQYKVRNAQGTEVTMQADAKYSDGNGFILDISQKDSAGGDFKGRTLIANNLAVNNGGSGIHSIGGRNVDVFNNTAYLNGDKNLYPDIYARETVDARFRNNIVYARPNATINSSTENTRVDYDYNVYFNGTIAQGTKGDHDIVGDPQFINPSLTPCEPIPNSPDVTCVGADFRILHASPALDKGVVIESGTPTTDINDIPRPTGDGIDIGAHEHDIKPRIVSALTVSGTYNTPMTYKVAAFNYPDSYAATGLPPGLQIDPVRAVISGTPTSRGVFRATVSATSEIGTGQATIVFTID